MRQRFSIVKVLPAVPVSEYGGIGVARQCPACGGPAIHPIQNVCRSRGDVGPGEVCIFACDEGVGCGQFFGIVAEPVTVEH